MHSTEEQLAEILRRADRINDTRKTEKRLAMDLLSSCACLALLVLTGYYISLIEEAGTVAETMRYGSLILTASYMGYVVVGLLASVLGISTAFLCIHWKKWRRQR